MPLYFGDRALVSLDQSSAGFHELPFGARFATGVTAPAAAGGTKNFAAKARVRVSTYADLVWIRNLTAVAANKITATCDLHTSPVYLDGILRNKIGGVRCILKVNASAAAVDLDGTLYNKITPTFSLAVLVAVLLDGTLTNKITLTGELYWRDGKRLEGTLLNRFSVTGSLQALGIGHGGTLRIRSVGNLAVLHIGTIHQPSALLSSKWTATAQLTINYMRALLQVPWSANCNLNVQRYLIGSSALRQTPTADLTVLRAFAASVGLKQTATARLFTPLRASAGLRVSASAVPVVVRQFTGLSAPHLTATLGLRVIRTYQASVGARQNLTGTLTADRRLAAVARVRSTGSVGLQVDRWLAGMALVRWTGQLVLTDTRPTLAPIGADITVMPDIAFETFPLPVQVESPDTTVYVEE